MDVLLIILGVLFLLAGIVGSVLPILPGPPLSYVAVLLLHFTSSAELSVTSLVIMGLVAAGITILDYVIPAIGTKKFGGTKSGKNGALIGTIAGIFIFPPFGILLGPFFGAFIGELIHDGKDYNKATKSAIGSFIGFILGVGLKLMYGLYVLYIYLSNLI